MNILQNNNESALAPLVTVNQAGFYSITLQQNYTIVYINTSENIELSFLDQDFFKVRIANNIKAHRAILNSGAKKFIPKIVYVFFPEHYNEQMVNISSFLNITIEVNFITLKNDQANYSCQSLLVGRNLPQELVIIRNNSNNSPPIYNFKENIIEDSVHRKLILDSFALRYARRINEIVSAEQVQHYHALSEPADDNYVYVQTTTLVYEEQNAANNIAEGQETSPIVFPIANSVENEILPFGIPLNDEERENYAQNQLAFVYGAIFAPLAIVAVIGGAIQFSGSTIAPQHPIMNKNTSHHIEDITKARNSFSHEHVKEWQKINYTFDHIPFPADELGYKQETHNEYLINKFQVIKINDPLIKLVDSLNNQTLVLKANDNPLNISYLRVNKIDTNSSSPYSKDSETSILSNIVIDSLELSATAILGYITYFSLLKPLYLFYFHNYVDLDTTSISEKVSSNIAELFNNALDFAGNVMEGNFLC